MKKLSILLALLCIIGSSYSQNENLYGYYYANGNRHYWTEDHTSLNIIVNNPSHYDSIATRLETIFNDEQDQIWADDEDNNIIVISNSLNSKNISDIVSTISLSNNDIAFTSYAKRINGNPIWLTNEVYVKLKNNTYYASFVQPVLSQYPSVTSYYEGYNEYRFVCPTDSIVVTLANKLYDTAYVVYSSPDYYSLGSLHTNDTYFNDQWNLKNTGQNSGTPGVDIKAEEAWAFVQKAIGTSGGNVKVAVIDDGVEEHEDFYEGDGLCVVLEGYTANGDGTGRPRPKNKHGECCAGIIAAVHNNIGIAGVAPHSRIVPIRICRNVEDTSPLLFFSNSKIAKAIRKSWQDYDASILSCSWKLREPNDYVEEAVVRAATEGRNGKGCIVVFSSGNDNSSIILNPNGLDEVLCVGAINENGVKPNYSNYGNTLDLVAPGQNIVTTDRMGNYGYCNNQAISTDYFLEFGMTSAACPHVSGVAALMLSVNPNLTREQVITIMESTAQKVGGYNYSHNGNHPNGTWNQNTGYGLVDAHMSVVKSFLFGHDLHISGPNTIAWNPCTGNNYSMSIPHPEYFTYSWSCSPNLTITPTNQNIVRITANGNGAGYIIVNVYSEGRLIGSYSKDIIVTNDYYSMGTSPISVTSDTNWSYSNYAVLNDVVIEPGVTLTITGTVYCANNGCFKVKPQGRLIVDGGHLTNLCPGEKWPGIEVWGDSTAHQYSIGGVCGQGRLELRNGALIENALCAVELWKPGDLSTTGGIVHADSTVFRNNTMAVHALHYTNHRPTNNSVSEYISDFSNCVFAIDDDYIASDTFFQHVDLECVNGIDFNGCVFSVSENSRNVSTTCCGINAYDAGFNVVSYCSDSGPLIPQPCPDTYLVRSSFSGFHDAVRSVSDGVSARSFIVHDAIFSHNDRGVFAQNIGYATVLRNDFMVGGKADCSYGVYASGVTGFCIEENTFTAGSGDGNKYGVGVFDCAGSNDIYHNTFEGLDCGNLAVGLNTSRSFMFSPETVASGLTYSCNQNSSNAMDFCVLRDNGVGGILPNQGSLNAPAGNTFGGSVYHIYNDGNQTLDYYYNTADLSQVPSSLLLHGVNTFPTTMENPCLTHYGSVVKSHGEKLELERAFLSADHWHERYMAASDIVRSDLHDTVANSKELRIWLGNMGDISADRTAIASYAQDGDFDNAFALAEKLPGRYDMQAMDLQDHADYMILLGIHKELHETQRTINQMTGNEHSVIENIAKSGVGFSRSMAQTMLRENLYDPNITYSCPTLPRESMRSTELIDNKDEGSLFLVTVLPNPASSWLRIEYTLPHACPKATFDLVNTLGERVMSFVLNGERSNETIQLDGIPCGVYSYTARSENSSLSGKLIIVP